MGFKIIPVYPSGKNPIGEKYQTRATSDLSQLIKWTQEHPGCNWGLMPAPSGLVVIDVDVKNGGLEYWKELIKELKLPIDTLTAQTGNGGFHFVFKAKAGMKYGSPLSKHGIDCQWKRIIVVFPSKNDKGLQYRWINEAAISEMPEELEKIFARSAKQKKENSFDTLEPKEYFEKIAAGLKDKEFGYQTWVQIGMAIHAAMPGDDGLRLWQEISSGINSKEGDVEKCEYKWSGFTQREDGLSSRSLGFIARELGVEVPNPFLEQDKKAFDAVTEGAADKDIELEAEQNEGWFKDDSGRVVSRHRDFILDALNKKGFFIEAESNAGKVGQLLIAPDNQKTVNYMRPPEFSTLIDNHFHKQWVWGERTGWRPQYTKVSKLWLESEERQEYRKVIFDVNDQPGALNLWSPLPLKPVRGDVTLFLELIFEGVANGDMDKAFWLIDWLAHIIQKPADKSSLVPVLLGDQGTGKGMLFDRIMKAILGHFHYKIMTSGALMKQFNTAQLARLLTFIDESTWRGNKSEDGVLKGLTGSRTLEVEYKFGASNVFNNYSRYAIASNNMEAVAIERSNRRYLVFEVNKSFAQKHSFFSEINRQLTDGNLAAAIYDHFLSRDLKDFSAHRLPDFGDGQGHQSKVASEGVIAQFWNDLFYHRPERLWYDETRLLKNWAYDEFIQFTQDSKAWEKGFSQEVFWRKTRLYFSLNERDRTRARLGTGRHDLLNIHVDEARKRFKDTLKLGALPQFESEEFILTDEQKEVLT